ncbi:MAG TPA: hypothetical protein VMF57_05505 [Solirubrobacteraceae bacterium]|nr:hypothetical protein [Solirubrobacteraceae bacterium]
MDPVAVDVRLINAVLATELKVAPGRVLMARVVFADGSGRGSLNIAGTTLEAELPKEVQTGQDLRLTVSDVSADRIELSLSDPSLAAAAAATAALPGGGDLQVTERDADPDTGGGQPGSGRHTLALRYDAPALGPIDLRFELDPESLRLSATFAAGDPHERALDAAGELQATLAAALGRSVTVDVDARHEPLDVYA